MKNVLVIDDDAAVRDAFEDSLGNLPYSVLTAASGEAGLVVQEENPVDLVYLAEVAVDGRHGDAEAFESDGLHGPRVHRDGLSRMSS